MAHQQHLTQIPGAAACRSCLSRRDLIRGVAAGCTAWGSLPACAQTPKTGPASGPLIRAAFVRPAVDRYFMGWPGAAYDIKARETEYRKVLMSAAAASGARLEIAAEPLKDEPAALAFASEIKSAPPDGVVLVIQSLNDGWKPAISFVQQRGDAPAFLFCPQGTSFTANLQDFRKAATAAKTHLAATPDLDWLRHGVHMLRTIWDMKQTRICVVQGKNTEEVKVPSLGGATLRYVPFERVEQEYLKASETDEVRRIADEYRKQARKIVEPKPQDIVDAIKHVLVCRRILETEGCHGLAMDCLPHVRGKRVPPPCLAFSHLNDQGVTAACQADWPAALSLRLTYLLLGQPGFMQNNCADTTNNSLIGAHCTCPTRLAGPSAPRAPFILRSHAESNLGVATQVLWPENHEVTIMKFSDVAWGRKPQGPGTIASSILLNSGRVLRNIGLPPSGGCVTSVEVKPNGVSDILTVKPLHHQLFILGNHVQKFKGYCDLAGIEVQPI